MPLATDVRYYHSDMAGIPQVSGSAGSLLSALHACLVTGFNLKTATSGSVASGVVTLTFGEAHGYQDRQVIAVSGATPSGVNGEHRITGATSTSLTYEVTGVADGAVSGALSVIAAPLGWVREFSGVNKSVYKIDPTKYPLSLPYRIRFSDDQSSQCMQCIGYETMSDIDTGVNRFPLAAQMASGQFINRSSQSVSSPGRGYHIIGTGRQFYIQVNSYETNDLIYAGGWSFFGEFPSYKSNDIGNFAMGGCLSTATTPSDYGGNSVSHNAFDRLYAARPFQGVGTPPALDLRGLFNDGGASGASNSVPYPNGPDNAVLLTRTFLTDNSSLRGYLPGLLSILNFSPSRIARSRRDPYMDDNVSSFPNRRIGYFTGPYSSSTWSPVAFDLTGPWY